MLDATRSALEARKRLRYPLNGNPSSELDIVGIPERRRQRITEAETRDEIRRAKLDFERRQAFERLIAEAKQNRALTIAIARKLGEDELRQPSVGDIMRAVCERRGFAMHILVSRRRSVPLVEARHVVMYLAREMTSLSLPQIGRRMGRMDHTTILYGARKIEKRLADDNKLAAEIEQLKQQLTTAVSTGSREICDPVSQSSVRRD